MVGSAIVFSLLLYLYFEHTLSGKALRATAINRVGARIVGIRPSSTGTLAFLLASLLGAISGVLIGPVTTMYYDSGFIIGLKAFVGAIIGGLVSYPGTALGADSGRRARKLRLVLEFGAQGSGGVRPLDPGAAVALAGAGRERRGRRGERGTGRRAALLLTLAVVAALAVAPLWVAPFTMPSTTSAAMPI